MAQRGIPCLWMRGGTSKAACFLADDLPADPVRRDAVLLAVMGSPDPRQIDGDRRRRSADQQSGDYPPLRTA
ncbi:fldA protein [Klebsiella pneumoniae]|nr:fldA protein [Klebsiella pneumoniae]